jgi:hypothetical protein
MSGAIPESTATLASAGQSVTVIVTAVPTGPDNGLTVSVGPPECGLDGEGVGSVAALGSALAAPAAVTDPVARLTVNN